jgi:hypothetical protein
MARIPDSEIERLKKEIAIERLVMGFGVELKKHGAELIGEAVSLACPGVILRFSSMISQVSL